jgi:hypothetical protein
MKKELINRLTKVEDRQFKQYNNALDKILGERYSLAPTVAAMAVR